jgi:hypothetical protein
MVKRRLWRHQRGSQNPYIWLPLWCLQTLPLTIVLSVRLRYKDSDYPFGVFKLVFWPLCCLFVFDIKILTTPLVSSNSSFDHCVVCSSSIYGFWLPLWCLQTLLLTIVLSVRLRYKDSDRRRTDNTVVKGRVWRHQRGSQNPYIEDEQTTQWSKEEFEDTKGIVRIFISKSNRQHNGQRTSLKTPKGQPESLYRRWTDNTMVKRIDWRHKRGSQNHYIKDSDYPCGVFTLFSWPLCCLFVFDITILTTPLVSSISSFDHCVVCSSSI